MREIKKIYVHASGSSPLEDIGGKEIGELHAIRGISSPHGYHDIVLRNGQGEKGRPIERQGAGARGHNEDSIHICLIGGVKEDGLTLIERYKAKRWGTPDANFTKGQYAYLEGLLDSYLLEFPHAEVEGHRDIPGVNKACPCFDVKNWYYETEDV